MSDFTTITNEEMELFEKLKVFFKDVAHLTMNHQVLEDNAVVFPSDLGPVLEKVDKEWWRQS